MRTSQVAPVATFLVTAAFGSISYLAGQGVDVTNVDSTLVKSEHAKSITDQLSRAQRLNYSLGLVRQLADNKQQIDGVDVSAYLATSTTDDSSSVSSGTSAVTISTSSGSATTTATKCHDDCHGSRSWR